MTTVDSTAADSPTATGGFAPALRRLYFVRFAFAVVWAALLFADKSHLGALGITLLVVYPLFDVAAAVVDIRSAGTTGPVRGLQANILISAVAAAGLGVAGASGVPAVLRVWGAWAIVAGAVQLIVGLSRRKGAMGGQWPMMLSGGISVLAGAQFALSASGSDPKLTSIGGYAILGGIFFLVSALRLGRTDKAR
ncbi:hypothetical protein SAMN05216251_11175 [Actinacidiphila alni]|uniref:DUF308 domain-containing protein n=1 Tax=Actinacidiphila alni TaxID=380248 RepID=A0A1I2HL43_9ACTN|nr:hypothetical protein [Actinacidiphila alni]SFF30402.1 hypothetical protein SAMN05216251_11175 [Actinacidiphila alni]